MPEPSPQHAVDAFTEMPCTVQDPGNLESDLQAGARTGYTLAWVLMWSTVMVRVISVHHPYHVLDCAVSGC